MQIMSFGAGGGQGLAEGGETLDGGLPAGGVIDGKLSGFSLEMGNPPKNGDRLQEELAQRDSVLPATAALGGADIAVPRLHGIAPEGEVADSGASEVSFKASGASSLSHDSGLRQYRDTKNAEPMSRVTDAGPQMAPQGNSAVLASLAKEDGAGSPENPAFPSNTADGKKPAPTDVDMVTTARAFPPADFAPGTRKQTRSAPQTEIDEKSVGGPAVGSVRSKGLSESSGAIAAGEAAEKVTIVGQSGLADGPVRTSKTDDPLPTKGSFSTPERTGASTAANSPDGVQVRFFPASRIDRDAVDVSRVPPKGQAFRDSDSALPRRELHEHAPDKGIRPGVDSRENGPRKNQMITTGNPLPDDSRAVAVPRSTDVDVVSNRSPEVGNSETRAPKTDAHAGIFPDGDGRMPRDERRSRATEVQREPTRAPEPAWNRPAGPNGAVPTPLSVASPSGERSPVMADTALLPGEIVPDSMPDGPVIDHLPASGSVDTARRTADLDLRQSHLARAVTQQIFESIRLPMDGSIEIRLSPDELGRVKLSMVPGEAGLVVQLVAERPETLDLLRRHADLLAAELRDAGYSGLQFSFSGEGGNKTQAFELSEDSPDTSGEPFASVKPAAQRQASVAGSNSGLDIRL